MKSSLTFWPLLAGTLGLSLVCSVRAEDPKIPGPNSFLRVLHAVPGGPKVDVFINNSKTLNDYKFGGFSQYLRLPSGYTNVKVTSNSPSRTLGSATPRLRTDNFYTAIAWGTPSRPRFRLVNDSLGRVPYNRARFTFFHLSPNLGSVDVYATTQAGNTYRLIRGLRYGQARPVNVPAAPMTIKLVQYGYTIKTYTGAEPRAGRKYVAYAIGYARENFNLFVDRAASQ